MNTNANFETAQVYAKVGFKERAHEQLLGVLSSIPPEARTADNAMYLKSLALLAQLSLHLRKSEEMPGYVDEGLRLKPDHADLLFMRALNFWDMHAYDEMFATCVQYLEAVTAPDAQRYEYDFAAPAALKEMLGTLIPQAYKRAPSREAFAAAVRRRAADSPNELLRLLAQLLAEQDLSEGA